MFKKIVSFKYSYILHIQKSKVKVFKHLIIIMQEYLKIVMLKYSKVYKF